MVATLPTNLTQTLTGHKGPVLCTRFNRKGTYCVSGGQDRVINLWNPHNGALVKSYSGHSHEIHSIDVSKDNTMLCSGGKDKNVFLWDVTSGKILRRYRGHASRVNCCRFNEEDSVVVSVSYDNTVQIFDVRARTWDAFQVLKEATDSVTSLDLSNHEIVTGSVDGGIRNYDLRAGKLRTDTLQHPVTNVAFSHDRNCILASTLNSTMHLLDKTSGDILATYKGHQNTSYKVEAELLATDSHVISGSEDGSIYIYDLVEGNVSARIRAHKNIVCSVSAHREKQCFLSCSMDGSVKVWKADGVD